MRSTSIRRATVSCTGAAHNAVRYADRNRERPEESEMKDHDFITIGKAASRSGVPPRTIRFYEASGLIAPAKRQRNSYRTYDERDIEALRFIHNARRLGFSVKETGELLGFYRDPHRASEAVKRLVLVHLAQLDKKIAELTAIRSTIAVLAQNCHGDMQPECPVIDQLAAESRDIVSD